MKTRSTMSLLAAAVLATACATAPMTTPTLDQARADFVAANNNPQVAKYAPLEFREASNALDQANAAAARRDSLSDVDRLAYVAKQRIANAVELAKAKAAEAEVANAARERDQVRLEVRTAEADRARREAQSAQSEAEQARMRAQAAQQQAQTAQMQAAAVQAQNAALAQRAAELEALLVELQAVKSERGYIVTIGDVLFALDKAELTTKGRTSLRKLAEVMSKNPNRTVMVEGFTDSTGSSAYNQELSQRRAEAVASALSSMGVGRERITVKGYGEAYPVAPNDSAHNRQLNRRVEIVLSNENQQIPPRTTGR